MRIIHTSDWHIGRSLYGRKRYDEFEKFLDWLAQYITDDEIDVLLVAGDIFDNIAPSNRAQELYYRFLCKVAASPSRHVIITGGNHDSPSFLNAPREVLRYLNVHVIGCAQESMADEVITLKDENGVEQLIVCAVPYLRDRDVRRAAGGESYEEKGRGLIAGIKSHYDKVCQEAEKRRRQLGKNIPIIAMGHLFTAGGKTIDSDGVRDLYVGSLAHVDRDIFPACIDYLALGHLHVPQTVGGCEYMRYSGSPLPISFGEAGQDKVICRIEIDESQIHVTEITVPRFQALKTLRGDWEQLTFALEGLKDLNKSVLLDVVYIGKEVRGDLRDGLEELVAGTALEILKIKNESVPKQLPATVQAESLADVSIEEVFQRCLDANAVPAGQQEELRNTYREAIAITLEEDNGAATGGLI